MSKVKAITRSGKFQVEYQLADGTASAFRALEPGAALFGESLAMLKLVKKLADAGLPFGDEPHDIDDSDVLDARALIARIEAADDGAL